jgi:putative glutathione S-transferase
MTSIVQIDQDPAHVPSRLLSWPLDGGRELRLARAAELDGVGALLQEAFTDGCWVTPTYLAHLAEVRRRSALALVWVIADADGPLAVVLTPKPQHLVGDAFTFNVLGVGTRGRGLGLGHVLVDHSVKLAAALGYDRLEIRSSPQMTAAHALYYRYGFVRRPDRETDVVDSGQRLHVFTYRIPETRATARVPYEEPTATWAFPGTKEETRMDITSLRPLVAPVTEFSTVGRDTEVERLVGHIVDDLIGGIAEALFAADVDERLAALRLFYARLGWFDRRVAGRCVLVGDQVTVADVELAAALVRLDFQYRAHLPRGSAAVADYPELFRFAAALVRDGLLPAAVLREAGVTHPGSSPWGEPAEVEGIADLRAAWLGAEAAA